MITRGRFAHRVPVFAAAAGLLVFATTLAAVPVLPNINTNNIITITNAPYNAVGDDVTTNTLAISNAIVAAAAGGNTNGLFGGTVRIPAPGTFLCGPLTLKNNVNLQIDAGATLKMLPLSVWTNLPAQNQTCGNLLYATGLTNLEISGSGTIDGQGADWWNLPTSSSVFKNRSYMIFFNGNCGRVLIQNVTFQNPPKMHIVFKGADNNITIQGITIDTPDSPNTDGIDLVGTNCLVQNCIINAGDDNIALGSSSSSAVCNDILVTNCTFGIGHGVSIGSNTAGGVSNLTVINCTFSGTDYGIRMKSSDNTSGGSGEGGIAQNLSYLNIGMTNIVHGAVVIYSYYDSTAGGIYGTPTTVTPFIASTQAVDVTTVPVWRNITISNVNATVASGGIAGIIWGRMEVPVTNVLFSHVNITAPKSFDVYNARGVQFADSKITETSGAITFLMYNAELIVTNSVFTTNLVTLDGLTTNGYGNSLAFYNAQASLKNTNVFDDGPLTLADSLFTVSNNFMLFPSTVLNFTLDPNTNRVAVVGNLALGGTVNLTNGPGFGAGTNTLLTYTGNLSGTLPTIGSTPSGFGYTYNFDTNTPGQVKLIVSPPAPPAPTNLTATGTNLLINLNWNAVPGATSYNLKRGTADGGPYPTVFGGLTVTNYSDGAVTNTVTCYYVVSAVNSGGESGNSVQASAAPLPSALPTNLVFQASNGQLQLSWPQDHLGWRLQVQTNDLSSGLGTNWVTVPDSTNVIQTNFVIDQSNGSVFLRLVYP